MVIESITIFDNLFYFLLFIHQACDYEQFEDFTLAT